MELHTVEARWNARRRFSSNRDQFPFVLTRATRMAGVLVEKIPDPRLIVAGRIGFSAGRISALIVRNNKLDGMAGQDRFEQAAKRVDLAGWKWIDAIVPIDQFDAD